MTQARNHLDACLCGKPRGLGRGDDLVLLTVSILDLRQGGDASIVHAIAAIYIGVSVGFGHAMIRWADVRFAHRFADGPAPAKPPKHGTAAARREARRKRRRARPHGRAR